MLFNSVDFAFFLPIVFVGYWFIFKNLKSQNIFLLVASYFFYSCWDWRFLLLLVFSTALDYFTGNKIYLSNGHKKKIWLTISILCNLGFLFYFKYYNFFIESFRDTVSIFGYRPSISTLKIILPVGISFYTFHGLSYVIDIYKDKIKPEEKFTDYALFVSYFPLLVAGPIERATHLLPQLKIRRVFSYALASDGMKQILWGLFKKIVIADNCGMYVDQVYANPDGYNGSSALLATIFFSFQIYADFSGYTDIASGVSKLFGIKLIRNFNYPYFAVSIADFWRKWHISLSSWFRDYVYIPLGGSRGSTLIKLRNVFIIFLLSGLWHGANVTFLVWGFIHACLFIPLLLLKTNRKSVGEIPSLRDIIPIIITFTKVCLARIFFRAENLTDALLLFKNIFSASLFAVPEFLPKKFIILIILFMASEWMGRRTEHPLAALSERVVPVVRFFVYYILVALILVYMGNDAQFIYFQF